MIEIIYIYSFILKAIIINLYIIIIYHLSFLFICIILKPTVLYVKDVINNLLIIKNNVLQVRKMSGITNKLIKNKQSNKVRIYHTYLHIFYVNIKERIF